MCEWCLPPLRDRVEDIPLLLDHLIARFNRLRGKDIAGVSPDVLSILMNQDFPGNVRELENIIEHAFVLCRGNLILPQHLPQALRPEEGKVIASPTATNIRVVEALFIKDALLRNNWNRAARNRTAGEKPSLNNLYDNPVLRRRDRLPRIG